MLSSPAKRVPHVQGVAATKQQCRQNRDADELSVSHFAHPSEWTLWRYESRVSHDARSHTCSMAALARHSSLGS